MNMESILSVLNAIKMEEGLYSPARELVEYCTVYTQAVLEHQLAIFYSSDTSQQAAAVKQADERRKAAHDSLMVKYSSLGRTYQVVKIKNCPLYRIADPASRKEVARLAIDLAYEIARGGLAA
jgi:hypothetical protein